VSGAGIEELKAAIVGALGAGGEEGVVVTSERQRDLVARSAAALVRAASAAQAGHAEEVLALEVREASQALAAVLGEEVGDDMLDALFARFCIGK
jgi:tRNA modification GTPase